ncbi:acetoacetate--CoA ligase [Rhodococcus sp. X156]|uniref:acetoacetate--CoA ligase n=1 Tax=Rhodococcus sp. X156 TaxID=2499145 RepID=UPI000FD880AB|nr:acetoacetate--CoA ligase [Rhodococcus sp. X156]
MQQSTEPIWSPGPEAEHSQLAAFARKAGDLAGRDLSDYADLLAWSTTELEQFWELVWQHFDVRSATPYTQVLSGRGMPGADWFTGATLSYVEHALRGPAEARAVVETNEAGDSVTTTLGQLRSEVAAVAAALRGLGVQQGDRVVGYLPNTRVSLVAFLATASLGATWSACGQDYGPAAATDRFAQLRPTVLVAADGYRFSGTTVDRRDAAAELAAGLPTLRAVVHVDHVGAGEPAPLAGGVRTLAWAQALATTDAEGNPHPLDVVDVAFDHPLWVLFSSGTTGKPKGIVHSHGGVLLVHLAALGLQLDLGPDDTFFWYTNTNWMMWNLTVAGLLVGSAVVLHDGSPVFPSPDTLWQVVEREGVTVFGLSPGYLLACEKAGLVPGRQHDLSALRTIGSTGSTLHLSAYGYVHDAVSERVQLVSTSGGTDVACAFVGGAPTVPVHVGEIPAAALGVALDAYGPEGQSLRGEVGELVVTEPMPSMPVFFWDDEDGSRYRAAYFDTYPGVWRHGDWITLTDRGSVVVHGRSDSTLNRNGVRLGSADIYEVVEAFEEVAEALVIGAEMPDGSYWMPMFLVLAEGATLDDDLRARIVAALRRDASPRHVPSELIPVAAIPHTRTGKKLEVPVKRVLQGADPGTALSLGAVDDPSLIDQFVRLGAERRAATANP